MIDVEVEADAWLAALPQVESLVLRAAGAALAAPRPGEAAPAGEDVVVLMADDGAVADLNARFRGQDKATNVLSFPAAPNPAGHLGDVALAFGVCAREADEQGKPLPRARPSPTMSAIWLSMAFCIFWATITRPTARPRSWRRWNGPSWRPSASPTPTRVNPAPPT